MDRRSFLRSSSAVTGLALFGGVGGFGTLLTACGDAPADSSPIDVPTGADEVVVRVEWSGGFTMLEWAFRQLPVLVIGGDRRVYTGAPVAEIYPGPLVYPINERSLSSAGLQQVMHLAASLGLLATPPDYDLPSGIGIADAADTVVTLVADGVTYVHRAYALDIEGTSTPARARLRQFVDTVGNLEALVGTAALGTEQPFVPARFRIRAAEATMTDPSGVEPSIVEWPADTGIVLREVGECQLIDAEPVRELFAAANEITRFDDGTTLWTLSVSTVLPGDSWECAARD